MLKKGRGEEGKFSHATHTNEYTQSILYTSTSIGPIYLGRDDVEQLLDERVAARHVARQQLLCVYVCVLSVG